LGKIAVYPRPGDIPESITLYIYLEIPDDDSICAKLLNNEAISCDEYAESTKNTIEYFPLKTVPLVQRGLLYEASLYSHPLPASSNFCVYSLQVAYRERNIKLESTDLQASVMMEIYTYSANTRQRRISSPFLDTIIKRCRYPRSSGVPPS